jgi:hypothetical protein
MQPLILFPRSFPARTVPTGHCIVAGRCLLPLHCAVARRSFINTLSLLPDLLILTHHFIVSTIHTHRFQGNLR